MAVAGRIASVAATIPANIITLATIQSELSARIMAITLVVTTLQIVFTMASVTVQAVA